MIIISTPTGDVKLSGKDEAAFLASLPGPLEPVPSEVSEQQSRLQLIAMGLNEEQIGAFFAAAAKL